MRRRERERGREEEEGEGKYQRTEAEEEWLTRMVQLLPVFNLLKSKNKNSGDTIDYSQRKRTNVSAEEWRGEEKGALTRV